MKLDFPKRKLFSVCPAALLALTMALPVLSIYLNNRNQFALTMTDVCLPCGVLFLSIFLISLLPFLLCGKESVLRLLNAAFFAFSLSFFLQYQYWSRFFLYQDMGALLIDLIVLLFFHGIALLFPFVVAFTARNWLFRNSGKMAAVLMLTQIVSALFPLLEKNVAGDYDFREYSFSETDKFTFAAEKNIIVVAVDCMGEQVGKEVLRKYPELQKELRDFTCFDHLESPNPRTMYAIPALLTGIPYVEKENSDSEEDDHAEYLKRACRDPGSVWRGCREHGYRCEGYPFFLQTISYAPDVLDNSIPLTQEMQTYSALKIWEAYLMQLLPDVFYPYMEQLWGLDPEPLATPVQTASFGQEETFDMAFYRNLRKNFRIGSFRRSFKYLHLQGAHDPVRNDENLEIKPGVLRVNQLRGSLKNVELLLKKLREAGLYDSSLIVITGDHSSHYTPEIITFFKRPGEHHERLEIRSVPGKIAALNATILKESGLSAQAKSLFDLPCAVGSLETVRPSSEGEMLVLGAWQKSPP